MENVSAYPPKKLNKSCENLKFPYKRRTLYNTCMYATWSFYMQVYSISSKKQFAIGLGTLVFLCSTCVGALILHVNSHIKWISRLRLLNRHLLHVKSVQLWSLFSASPYGCTKRAQLILMVLGPPKAAIHMILRESISPETHFYYNEATFLL